MTTEPTPQATKIGDTVNIKNTRLILSSQADLCAAMYALYSAGEDEKDEKKKQSLRNVEDALNQITNHYGVDGIGNFDLLKEYEVIK